MPSISKNQIEQLLRANMQIPPSNSGTYDRTHYIVDPHTLVRAFGWRFDDCTPPNLLSAEEEALHHCVQ